eukprot:6066470-Pleurochrysis_carterae.AAC.1
MDGAVFRKLKRWVVAEAGLHVAGRGAGRGRCRGGGGGAEAEAEGGEVWRETQRKLMGSGIA